MQRGGLRFLYPKIRITLRKNRRKIKYFTEKKEEHHGSRIKE